MLNICSIFLEENGFVLHSNNIWIRYSNNRHPILIATVTLNNEIILKNSKNEILTKSKSDCTLSNIIISEVREYLLDKLI